MSDVYDNGDIMRDPRMIALCTGCTKPDCGGICQEASQLARSIAKEKPCQTHGGKLYAVGDESHTLPQWSRIAGISQYTLSKRVKRGMTMAEAIATSRIKGKQGKQFEIGGVKRTMNEWAKIADVTPSRLYARMAQGMSLEEAVKMGRRNRR